MPQFFHTAKYKELFRYRHRPNALLIAFSAFDMASIHLLGIGGNRVLSASKPCWRTISCNAASISGAAAIRRVLASSSPDAVVSSIHAIPLLSGPKTTSLSGYSPTFHGPGVPLIYYAPCHRLSTTDNRLRQAVTVVKHHLFHILGFLLILFGQFLLVFSFDSPFQSFYKILDIQRLFVVAILLHHYSLLVDRQSVKAHRTLPNHVGRLDLACFVVEREQSVPRYLLHASDQLQLLLLSIII